MSRLTSSQGPTSWHAERGRELWDGRRVRGGERTAGAPRTRVEGGGIRVDGGERREGGADTQASQARHCAATRCGCFLHGGERLIPCRRGERFDP